MNYTQFKSEYITTLQAFLNVPTSDNYTGFIVGPKSNVLTNRLADMEEQHPDWVERIEDGLAARNELQQ